MKKKSNNSRPLLFFYLLVAYVFIQCLWWSYHLMQLDNEVFLLRSELAGYTGQGAELIPKKRWTMIVGEGIVFVFLLFLGAVKIRKSFKKEAMLARQQNNFLLSVTHELRSPLASTRLQIETLEKRELPREKQKEIFQSCIGDIDRLNNLVENLLLTANIDNKAFSLYKEKADLSEFIENAIGRIRISMVPSPKIISEIQPGVYFYFDKMAMTSIINNLVENAIKYSSAGSAVSVLLKRSGGNILLSVADQGIGIAAEERSNIFKKFYRAENEETRKTKGTGLGLYIVKRMVEEQDGEIIVKPNSPIGSIFEIVFPEKNN